MRSTAAALALLAVPATLPAAPPAVPGPHNHPEMAAGLAGEVLLTELNCVACHRGGDLPAKGAPDLSAVATRVSPAYLEEFIAAPHATKPGTTMPDVLGGLPEGERTAAARAIADYLGTLGDGLFTAGPVDREAVGRGEKLFHQVGCAACHSPEGTAIRGSPPLHRIEDKYGLAGLTAFLEDPLAVRPGGRMPDLHLDHFEAADIASYLLRDQKPTPPRRVRRPENVARGKALFREFGCAQCHAPGTAVETFAPPLAGLAPGATCGSARYPLSETQGAQIAAALATPDRDPSPEVEIQLALTRLNCIACHRRDSYGGVPPGRDPFFTTSNLNLGEQARIPPPLTGVGAKLDPKWLRKVALGDGRARPYMHTRMPAFGAANVGRLLELLPEADSLPPAAFERTADERAAQAAGHQLVGNKNLSCVACHTFKGESATTLDAVELTTMAARLREDWFHHFMREPQRFHPSTIMPSFWPAGKAVRPELLDGDPGRQIDAIWQYLKRGREAPTPAGIKREPIEYGPAGGEAVMLRRQYRGIGKRGIGVGYPSGINIAFDAGQLRLGSVWAGGFGEMSGVWRGQGSGSVHERGRGVVRFPAGPALATLADRAAAWPELAESKRPEGFQFQGYTLDRQQRPTFRYTFAGLAIADRFVDDPEGPSLTRTLTFDKPAPAGLYLRLAAAEDPEATAEAGTFQLPHNLSLKTPAAAFLRRSGDTGEILLPLGGETSATIVYAFDSK